MIIWSWSVIWGVLFNPVVWFDQYCSTCLFGLTGIVWFGCLDLALRECDVFWCRPIFGRAGVVVLVLFGWGMEGRSGGELAEMVLTDLFCLLIVGGMGSALLFVCTS